MNVLSKLYGHRNAFLDGPVTEVWYRYEDWLTTGGVDVCCWELEFIKKTPMGVVIRDVGGQRRFIADRWTKKYACPTKALALESFVARKTKQISIYEARARNARRAIAKAQGDNVHKFSGGFSA